MNHSKPRGAKQRKALRFQEMLAFYKDVVACIEDKRKGKNCQHQLTDAYLAALSVFYFQYGSFLAYQRQLEAGKGSNNVKTLFGVKSIPSDNRIRTLLDEPGNEQRLRESITRIVDELKNRKQLDRWQYKKLESNWLIALDGTCFYRSEKLGCCDCQHAGNKQGYQHSLVTPVLVNPEQKGVIPLPPEFVRGKREGEAKEGCERTAATRWFETYGDHYTGWGTITFLGDALYANQPWCKGILAKGHHFILTCKRGSHKTLYDYLSGVERLGALEEKKVRRWTGKRYEIDRYRYYSKGLPLRDGEGALEVSWCELRTQTEEGKRVYHNAFVSDRKITSKNVHRIVEVGRCRWKVENENNNTLKRHGYALGHNFGHGKRGLANVFAVLNILAFLMHTVHEIVSEQYLKIREKLGARRILFEHLKSLSTYIVFSTWDRFFEFIAKHLKLKPT